MLDEGGDAALVLEHVLLAAALVQQLDAHPGVEEGQLPQAFGQDVVLEHEIAEYLGAGLEPDVGAGGAGLPRRLERLLRHPEAVSLVVDLAVAPDRELEPFRQGVDNGDADAVQATGDLVRVLVEFAARMQHRHDHLGGGPLFLGDDVGRDAAAVVADGDGAVVVDDHLDLVAVAGQGLVNRVVHGLEHHVVQAGAVVRVPDIHAGALAHGVQPLEDLDAA